MKTAWRILRWGSVGFLLLFLAWIAVGVPFYFDRLCVQSETPIDAEYIVCVGAGLDTGNLPTDDGWKRIYTSVQLYLDGYGQKIVFTGGGAERVSEAEVYAEAARWLGLAEGDALLDPGPNQTSEHPSNIQKIAGAGIIPATPLNIVTSPLHSKRTALCFKKAGYSQFRLVTHYQATGRRSNHGIVVSRPEAAPFLRTDKISALPSFKKSDKSYNDIFNKMRARSWRFFTSLRELAAMAAYKLKGYI